jgi:hypothetical protein
MTLLVVGNQAGGDQEAFSGQAEGFFYIVAGQSNLLIPAVKYSA